MGERVDILEGGFFRRASIWQAHRGVFCPELHICSWIEGIIQGVNTKPHRDVASNSDTFIIANPT